MQICSLFLLLPLPLLVTLHGQPQGKVSSSCWMPMWNREGQFLCSCFLCCVMLLLPKIEFREMKTRMAGREGSFFFFFPSPTTSSLCFTKFLAFLQNFLSFSPFKAGWGNREQHGTCVLLPHLACLDSGDMQAKPGCLPEASDSSTESLSNMLFESLIYVINRVGLLASGVLKFYSCPIWAQIREVWGPCLGPSESR